MRYLLLLLSLLVPHLSFGQDLDDRLAEAYQAYVAGEKATSNQERSQRFNEALAQYSILTNEFPHVGELQFNVANCYFQLGEYGWAILHYYRAYESMPREERVVRNLNIAAQRAGVPGKSLGTPLEQLLYPHYKMSLGERYQALFLLSLLTLLCGSLAIWLSSRGVKRLAVFFALLVACGLLSVGISQYAEPIDAIVVRPATLHTDAGNHYAEVLDKPLLAGSKVRVLEVADQGRWLKITSPQGVVGYAESERLRIISQ